MPTFVVTGLGFGDEGKGTAVDYLARQLEKPIVIRSTSGPQAAHNVVLPNGDSHTFSQFGSGFFSGAHTVYAAPVCDPLAMVKEGRALENIESSAFGMITVSADAIITTPYHQAANKLREILRGNARHGSCGYGINEAVTLASLHHIGLCVGDLRDGSIEDRLEKIRAFYEAFIFNIIDHYHLDDDKELESIVEFITSEDSVGHVADLYKEFNERVVVKSGRDIYNKIKSAKNRIFESAQGVLLDPQHGFFFPNVTRLSPFDVLKYLEGKDYHHVLCARTYMSRHGAGPFLSEDDEFEGHDPHNLKNSWQGGMRYGPLDIPSLKYAVDLVKRYGMYIRPKLFVTHLDITNSGKYVAAYSGSDSITSVMDEAIKCRKFTDPNGGRRIASEIEELLVPEYKDAEDLTEVMAESLGTKVGWMSTGETYQDKVEL